jgi:hypothetical protein
MGLQGTERGLILTKLEAVPRADESLTTKGGSMPQKLTEKLIRN